MNIFNRSLPLFMGALFFSLILCEGILILAQFPLGTLSGNFSPFWLNQPGLGLSVQKILKNVADPKNVISSYEYDIDHAIRLKSNIDKRTKAFAIPFQDIEKQLPSWRIVTDSFHHRVWNDKKRDKNKNLLLILGGSSPFGWGVDFEHSFPSIIAQSEKKAVTLMNLAVPGYSIYDALLIYRKERSKIKEADSFRLIIDAGSNNTGLSSMSDHNAYKNRHSFKGKSLLVFSKLRIYWLAKRFLSRFSFFKVQYTTARVPPSEYKVYLKELITMAKEDGGKILIMNICNNEDELTRIMKKQAAESHVTFFDVDFYFNEIIDSVLARQFPELNQQIEEYRTLYGNKRIEEYPRWLLEFHPNCHPNILGHRLIAGKIREIFKPRKTGI